MSGNPSNAPRFAYYYATSLFPDERPYVKVYASNDRTKVTSWATDITGLVSKWNDMQDRLNAVNHSPSQILSALEGWLQTYKEIEEKYSKKWIPKDVRDTVNECQGHLGIAMTQFGVDKNGFHSMDEAMAYANRGDISLV